jgi:hypothetical protein
MNLGQLFRAAQAVIGLTEAARRVRRESADPLAVPFSRSGALAPLEARLAGVLVAALKEAFDRDRARLDLERAELEAERKRAEEAMRLERLRQAGEREIGQIRIMAGVAVVVWITSVVFAMLQGPSAGGISKVVLGLGWAFLLAALGCAFAAHRALAVFLARAQANADAAETTLRNPALVAAPWLVVSGLGFTAASLLLALFR